MKKSASTGEKAGIEIQKLQKLLTREKDQRSVAEAATERVEKQLQDSQAKIKQLTDQIGGLTD